MEGCAFAYRHIVDHLGNAGFPIIELRATGGPTKSDVWNQINSDVCGVPIVLIETLSDASIGDAMIAGVGTGVFTSFAEAVKKTVKVGKRYEPIEENVQKYQELFSIYKEIYEGLKGVFKKLSVHG